MPRNIVTKFVKIATAGDTVDGRNISENSIQEMAETYDREDYTAVISYEHIKYFGNFGMVQELKAEKDGKGRMSLYAKLTPSDELLYFNRNGQKLFTSVEINPNFANTGKAYLVGLAVTDTPASLGTEELHFSKRKQDPSHVLTQTIELGQLTPEKDDSFLGRIFNRNTDHFTSDNEDDMSKEALQKIEKSVASLSDKIETFSEQLSKTPAAKDDEPPAPTDAFSELKTAHDALAEKFGKLEQENTDLKQSFTELKASLDDQVPGTDGGQDTGGENPDSEMI